MYISIDVGTTNLKMTLIDSDYKVHGQESYRHKNIRMTQTDFEMDIEEIWQALIAGVEKLSQETYSDDTIQIILTTAMHSLVLLNDASEVITPVYAWNDSRGADAIATLSLAERTEQYQRTGTPIHSMNPYFKVKYWLNKFGHDVRIGSIKDVLFFRLTGEWMIDEASASATGLYNLVEKGWDTESLSVLDIEASQLPIIRESKQSLKVKTKQLKDLTGLVYLGTTDGVASNYACKSLTDAAVLTIGTSHAVRVISNQPRIDALSQNFCYHIQEEEYLVGYPSNNGGNVIEWIVENYATTFEHLDTVANKSLVPEAIFLPYLNGERSPIWNDQAMAELVDLHRNISRDQLLYSMLCGTFFNMRQNLENLLKQTSFSKLCLVGGIVNNSGFVQLITDIMGIDVLVPTDQDAERLGSVALIKGEEVTLAFEKFKPNMESHQMLSRYYHRYLLSVKDRHNIDLKGY